MKKSIILAAVFSLVLLSAWAQGDYKSAIGGRIGSPISFSFKHFIMKPGAIELNAGFAPVGYGSYFRFGGMYQHHFPIGEVEGLKWYVGGGVLFDVYSYKSSYSGYSNSSFGLNAVGGVDYKFRSIPLNVSADWMPAVLLDNDSYRHGFRPDYGGLAVRYVLK